MRRASDTGDLLAAVHEAGHALVFAALGMPMARATARQGRGEVVPDKAAARMLSVRHKRRHPDPVPRGALVAAALGMMAVAVAGERAVLDRAAARPCAAWHPHVPAYGRMSRRDAAMWRASRDELRALDAEPPETGGLVDAWTDWVVARHRDRLARLAVLLWRRGRLSGPEIDRLLAPVAADPEPTLRLLEVAARLIEGAPSRQCSCAGPEGCSLASVGAPLDTKGSSHVPKREDQGESPLLCRPAG